MSLVLESPVCCRLPAAWVGSSVERELTDALGYEDKRATHEWRRWYREQKADDGWLQHPSGKRGWFVEKYGRDALDAKVAQLAAQRYQTVLFRDERGLWTYSGVGRRLAKQYGEDLEYGYAVPAFNPIDWSPPEYGPRWYQTQADEMLSQMVHGGVELATGLGKSFIMAMLLKRIGLPSLVVAPSLSIAEQLLADLTDRFGKRKVGKFFDGKKESDRLFTVAVSKSLQIVEPDSKLWKQLRQKQVLIGDESHLLPAETLSKVILGMLDCVPYRFFLSGTQLRTDGLDLLLEGIVGDICMRMSVREGVEQNFLAEPRFYQFDVPSNSNFNSGDVIKMNRVHLHGNEAVYRHAGNLVNRAIHEKGRRALVLVEEVGQFKKLLQFGKLDVQAGFAHGGVNKDNKEDVPEAYWKSDPRELVRRFDAGEFPCLVGTACISTGTDIKSADLVVDLVGLTSEIALRQRIGRGTRLWGAKKSFVYADYAINNVPVLAKHAKARAKILDDVHGPVKYIVT